MYHYKFVAVKLLPFLLKHLFIFE